MNYRSIMFAAAAGVAVTVAHFMPALAQIARPAPPMQGQPPQQQIDPRLVEPTIQALQQTVQAMQAQLKLRETQAMIAEQDDMRKLDQREREWQEYFSAYIGEKKP